MGQGGHYSNTSRRNGRNRSQGQTGYRYFAALACFLVIVAVAASQSKTAKSTAAKTPAKKVTAKATAKKKIGAQKLAIKPQAKVVEPSKDFDKNLAWKHLTTQCDLGPRVPGTSAHDKAYDYIYNETAKYCDEVRTQKFSYRWSKNRQVIPMKNIIGTQNWKNSSVKVVLLTHWDSRPLADQDPIPENRIKPVPAANDGASGVAVMLELMRVLKNTPSTVGILYLFTDGEDLGPGGEEMYLGAKVFANEIPKMYPKPTYGILLDMIGDKDLSIPMEQRSLGAAPDLMKAFYRHAETIGLGDTFISKTGYLMDDDHMWLIDRGLPTIDLIDFDYEPWHTVNDTPEHCSPESLGKVGKMLQSWLTMKTPWRPGMVG